jgi:hypothetical protein
VFTIYGEIERAHEPEWVFLLDFGWRGLDGGESIFTIYSEIKRAHEPEGDFG